MMFLASTAQKLPVNEKNTFFKNAYKKISTMNNDNSSSGKTSQGDQFHSGVNQAIRKIQKLTPPVPVSGNVGGDTLVVGQPPNDSLIITGAYTHFGPVIVINNGILRFRHTYVTIIGDLWVAGKNALVTADSSTLYFPQQYFYQRSLAITEKGRVEYNHTTLDYSGLSHNLFIADSGSITMNHVKDIGFTTCGLNGTLLVDIENSDEPSEYVITDKAHLTFRNDTTLLLWHQDRMSVSQIPE